MLSLRHAVLVLKVRCSVAIHFVRRHVRTGAIYRSKFGEYTTPTMARELIARWNHFGTVENNWHYWLVSDVLSEV